MCSPINNSLNEKQRQTNLSIYRGTSEETRRGLFREALLHAKHEKVLYILKEELMELPSLSQDVTTSRNCMKMISFLYAWTLETLLGSLSTLSEWQQVPTTLILDSLHEYCPKDQIQNACAVIALLVDSAQSCFLTTKVITNIIISIDNKIVGDYYCNLLTELYSSYISQ